MGVSVGSSIYNAPSIYEIGAGGGGGGGGPEIDGRVYKTITIGGATWLGENLDFKFSGCGIGGDLVENTPHAWYYDNDEATYGIDGTRKCGLLYNWHACKLLNDNINSLVPGWHVPTKDEWTALANEVGGNAVAGTKLKAANVIWSPSWGGTDEYKFCCLPTGYYYASFNSDIYAANFWTITEKSSSTAYSSFFDTGPRMNPDTDEGNKNYGFSIRLVKD